MSAPPVQHLPLAAGDELLDHPDADAAVVCDSLHHISTANRWFGGWWAVRRGLVRLLAGVPAGTRLTLLDIGTGAGDLPLRAVDWAARRGITLVPLGIERHPAAARLACQQGVPTLLACAGQLPVRPGGIDIVIASQLIHHLAPSAIVEFCRDASTVARHGVVIADLRRSSLARAAFWLGSRLLAFDSATKADGLTSIRRGFTGAELSALLRSAGVSATVERGLGFRLVAAWRTGPA